MPHTLALTLNNGCALVYQQSNQQWTSIKSFNAQSAYSVKTDFGFEVCTSEVNWDITVVELLSMFTTLRSAVTKFAELKAAELGCENLIGAMPDSAVAQFDRPRVSLVGQMSQDMLSPLNYIHQQKRYRYSIQKHAWCFPTDAPNEIDSFGFDTNDMNAPVRWTGEQFCTAVATWINNFIVMRGTMLEGIYAKIVLGI